jgi:hypothetical protein
MEFHSVIDSNFMELIGSLHRRFDVLESDFEYIEKKVIELTRK